MGEEQFNPFLNGLRPQAGPKMEDLDQLACGACGNGIFDQYYRMYRMSAINSPTGKANVYHVPVFACAGCGDILDIKKAEAAEAAGSAVTDKEESTEDKTAVDDSGKNLDIK
jgi:hypothetical protein